MTLEVIWQMGLHSASFPTAQQAELLIFPRCTEWVHHHPSPFVAAFGFYFIWTLSAI